MTEEEFEQNASAQSGDVVICTPFEGAFFKQLIASEKQLRYEATAITQLPNTCSNALGLAVA